MYKNVLRTVSHSVPCFLSASMELVQEQFHLLKHQNQSGDSLPHTHTYTHTHANNTLFPWQHISIPIQSESFDIRAQNATITILGHHNAYLHVPFRSKSTCCNFMKYTLSHTPHIISYSPIVFFFFFWHVTRPTTYNMSTVLTQKAYQNVQNIWQ